MRHPKDHSSLFWSTSKCFLRDINVQNRCLCFLFSSVSIKQPKIYLSHRVFEDLGVYKQSNLLTKTKIGQISCSSLAKFQAYFGLNIPLIYPKTGFLAGSVYCVCARCILLVLFPAVSPHSTPDHGYHADMQEALES